MTAPTTQAEQEDAVREALAAWLMAHDESAVHEDPAHYVEHFHDFVHGFRASLHSGDCTKEAHACTRCLCDAYLKRADALIAGPLAHLRTERDQLAADLSKAREETEAMQEACLKAALGASYGPPSSWPGDYPKGWRHPPSWGPDEKPSPTIAAWHDNGARDAWFAIRALTPDPKDAGGTAKGDDHG